MAHLDKLKSWVFALLFFVCPLLFFTDLTRNPYFTQIALLNSLLLLAGWLYWIGFLYSPAPSVRTCAADLPLLCWLVFCGVSWIFSYLSHPPFFQPAIFHEGHRVFAFTLVNCLLVYFLAAQSSFRPESYLDPPAWRTFFLGTLCWGSLWSLLPSFRAEGQAGLYGTLLWGVGTVWVFRWVRFGSWARWIHLALAVGFLASAYSLLQYFGWEWIWPRNLNAYGSRSISTFGNPNFLSSYLVLLLPFSLAGTFLAQTAKSRLIYLVIFLTYLASLLITQTRSSWLGAFLAAGLLLLHPFLRAQMRRRWRWTLLACLLGAGVFLFWPQSFVTASSGALRRVADFFKAFSGDAPLVYAPWHQRLLIWSCAWQMVQENPFFGKGWGTFELFYPFYQGPMLVASETFRFLRTHANNVHNEVLEVWSQIGGIGLGVFLWFWITWIFYVLRQRLRFPGDREVQSVWGRCLLAGIVGMWADNLLNVSLHFAVPAFLFWFLAGSGIHGAAGAGVREFRLRRFSSGALRGALAGLGLMAAGFGIYRWFADWKAEVHYFQGFKLIRNRQLPAARRHLEISRDWRPYEVNANYELGNAYARSEMYAEALAAYREALKANAGYDEIYYNFATLAVQKLGRLSEAQRYYQTALHINPLSQEAYSGFIALTIRDPQVHYRQAVSLLEQATALFPDNKDFWNNLGYFYSTAQEYEQALRAYAQALRIDPSFELAEKNLRTTLQNLGRKGHPALLLADRMRDLEGRIQRQDFSGATLRLAETILEGFPQQLKARFYRGNLYAVRGEREKAIQDFEWVLQHQPDHAGALKNLNLLKQ
ncbi:MAG: tetratricopeptide repeat protein [Elusimicrobia bacterium]|nr:tetratricopeptide repeat protein [Elusimicrobiota bacterium]